MYSTKLMSEINEWNRSEFRANGHSILSQKLDRIAVREYVLRLKESNKVVTLRKSTIYIIGAISYLWGFFIANYLHIVLKNIFGGK